MNQQTIDLKKELPVENGGHILYVFSNKILYIENLVAYIVDGVKLGHRVLVIDQTIVYREVQKLLTEQLSEEELQYVYFEDNGVFYAIHDDFQVRTNCGSF